MSLNMNRMLIDKLLRPSMARSCALSFFLSHIPRLWSLELSGHHLQGSGKACSKITHVKNQIGLLNSLKDGNNEITPKLQQSSVLMALIIL